MTTPRSKSPKPQNSFRKDDSKDETTFWDKIGTLGRKKRIKEGRHFNITLYGHHSL
jgi:parvin